MKKGLFLLPFAITALTISSAPLMVAAEDTPVSQKLDALITEYIGENSRYTKKTTICLNDATVSEMERYFHCKQTQPKRTTYYDDANEMLLMAFPDGSLETSAKYSDAVTGGYKLNKETKKVHRIIAKEGATLDTMFDDEYILTKSQASYSNREHLYDCFVNLTKLKLDGFKNEDGKEDWGYASEYKEYYYNVTSVGLDANNDRYYSNFLGFTAPMLTPPSSQYLSIKSLGISERKDAFGEKYLSLRIYVKDQDKSKIDPSFGRGDNVLSEARIYKGIRPVGEEDLSVGYYVVGSFNNWSINKDYRLTYMKSETLYDEFELHGISLQKGNQFKILSTNDVWFDNWENDVFGRTTPQKSDYYVPTSGTYNIYFKLSTNSQFNTCTYVGMDTKDLYLKPGVWNTDNAWFQVHIWNNDVNFDITLEKYSDDCYKCLIPNSFTSMLFYRRNPDGGGKWNQTKDLIMPQNMNCYKITGWGDSDGEWIKI
ncbi:MAG: hypothetical protein MJ227_00930 [Bacilli bacterium]|nr:hypothetical protein [Bacilli bacterium]